MLLLRVAITVWIVGCVLAFALRGVIHLLTALAVMLAQPIVQVVDGRHLT